MSRRARKFAAAREAKADPALNPARKLGQREPLELFAPEDFDDPEAFDDMERSPWRPRRMDEG